MVVFRFFFALLWFLTLPIHQMVAQTSETELFQKHVSRNAKLSEQPNIELNIGLNVIGDSRFYGSIYQAVDNGFYEFVPQIRGFIPLSKRWSVHLAIPYLVKFGFIEMGRLPGSAFKSNSGWGDFSTSLTWQTATQSGFPAFIMSHLTLLAPIGQSRFDETYKGFYPLGNGFWTLATGASIKKVIFSKFMIYTNWAFVSRFSRTFSYSPSKYDLYNPKPHAFVTLNPDPIQIFRAGFGCIAIKGVAFNFEYESVFVGSILAEHRSNNAYSYLPSNVRSGESSFRINRYGLKIEAPLTRDYMPTLFLGFEKYEDKTTFVTSFFLPGGCTIFGIKF